MILKVEQNCLKMSQTMVFLLDAIFLNWDLDMQIFPMEMLDQECYLTFDKTVLFITN